MNFSKNLSQSPDDFPETRPAARPRRQDAPALVSGTARLGARKDAESPVVLQRDLAGFQGRFSVAPFPREPELAGSQSYWFPHTFKKYLAAFHLIVARSCAALYGP